jgi:O-succinylbenzoate synthase
MKINHVELRIIRLPLVRPFRTSFGTQFDRELLLMKITMADGVEGWAECVAMSEPLYSPEYTLGSQDVTESFLLPKLFAYGDIRAEEVADVLKPFLGHQMAKATIETAILDAQLKCEGISFGSYLGSSKSEIDCGVSVGIASDIDALVQEVSGYIAEGYRRVKLKIEPGWDFNPVGVIRGLWPDIPLQVDANQAYTRNDVDLLRKLDAFNLLLIEQPLDEHDMLGHALLAKELRTPICLDESITSLGSARDAIAMKATTIINIKPGRVGGYMESVRIHDFCVEHNVSVWCGGMLETGIGRAANIALASLPGFTLPGDTSASSRYFHRDITTPFVMQNGQLTVPHEPGIGVEIDHDFIEEITTSKRVISAPQ